MYIPTLINRSLLLSANIWFLFRQRHCLAGRPWPLERYNNIEKVEFLDAREPLPATATARSRRIVSSKFFNYYFQKKWLLTIFQVRVQVSCESGFTTSSSTPSIGGQWTWNIQQNDFTKTFMALKTSSHSKYWTPQMMTMCFRGRRMVDCAGADQGGRALLHLRRWGKHQQQQHLRGWGRPLHSPWRRSLRRCLVLFWTGFKHGVDTMSELKIQYGY